MLAIEQLYKSFPTPKARSPYCRGGHAPGAGQQPGADGRVGQRQEHFAAPGGWPDRADSGRILIDDVPLDGRSEASLAQWRREGIGLVFQQYNLISSLDVGLNLTFQARLAGRHDPHWAAYLAQRLGLADLLERYPEQLSGGQQQRVAIGRALAGRPAWLLADEPTGSLDEASSDEVLSLLLQLVAEAGSGVLMVTHSPRLAARLQRRCYLQAGRVRPEQG